MKRVLYLDITKGLAIFLVVWGHIIGSREDSSFSLMSYNIIYSFHMPIFAIISGLFFNPETNWKIFVQKKTILLVLPLAFWVFIFEIIGGLFRSTIIYFDSGEPIHLFAIARNFFYGICCWHLWFLKALFLCFCYAYISAYLCRSKMLLASVSSVVLLYTLSLCGVIPNKSPFFIGFIFLYPFFWIGYYMNRYKEKLQSNALLIIAIVAYILLFLFWEGDKDTFYGMNTNYFATDGIVGNALLLKITLRFLICVIGSFVVIEILRRLICNEKIDQNIIFIQLSVLGKYTLAIYILHILVVFHTPFCEYLKASGMLNAVSCILISLILTYVCWYLAVIVQKNRLLAMLFFGKR